MPAAALAGPSSVDDPTVTGQVLVLHRCSGPCPGCMGMGVTGMGMSNSSRRCEWKTGGGVAHAVCGIHGAIARVSIFQESVGALLGIRSSLRLCAVGARLEDVHREPASSELTSLARVSLNGHSPPGLMIVPAWENWGDLCMQRRTSSKPAPLTEIKVYLGALQGWCLEV